MSNNNDMKLIMEEWRRTISEIGPQDVGPGSMPSFDSSGNRIPDSAEATEVDFGKVWDDFFKWYDSQETWLRFIVDLFVPLAGDAVDIRQAVEDWEKWEEWYNLDATDPRKYPDPKQFGGRAAILPTGEELFVNAIVSIILAIPILSEVLGFAAAFKIFRKIKKAMKFTKSPMFTRFLEVIAQTSILTIGILGKHAKDEAKKKGKKIDDIIAGDRTFSAEYDLRRKKQAYRMQGAIEKLEKYEKQMAELEQKELEKQRKEKERKEKEEKSRVNPYDDTPAAVPGRLQR
jgi:hypothetical protein